MRVSLKIVFILFIIFSFFFMILGLYLLDPSLLFISILFIIATVLIALECQGVFN